MARRILSSDEISELFSSFTTFAFRLESLPHYSIHDEAEGFSLFCKGEPLPPPRDADQQDWDSFLSSARSARKTVERVRIVPQPLTPYFRFELEWGYYYTARAGEDIRFLLPSEQARLSIPSEDFWLFDHRTIIFLIYNQAGEFIRAELETDPTVIRTYSTSREILLQSALPLIEYLAQLRTQ